MFEKSKLKQLLLKVELLNKQHEENGFYSLLQTKYVQDYIDKLLKSGDVKKTYIALKNFYDISLRLDSEVQINYQVGKIIDDIVSDKTSDVLIHRTNLYLDENDTSNALKSIMENGLINYGHTNAMGGTAFLNMAPSLGLTTTPLNGLSGYINLLSSWHENDSIIIIKIPKGLLDSDFDYINENDIYNQLDGKYYIKPEYMVGNIVRKNNKLNKLYTKEEILCLENKASNRL